MPLRNFSTAKANDRTCSNDVFTFLQLRVLLLAAGMIWSCAGQFPPSGGPEDKDPPSIIATYPEHNSTRFQDSRIVFEFDEYVDRPSLENALFISPNVGMLEFDWSGREVEIRFSERLRENTTYVVNVGTDVVDVRNRNRMAESFTLAFSTGHHIDEGVIEGRVYPAKPADPSSGIMVFAYRLDPLNPDTLDPRRTKPDYSTQTGKEGKYTLSHLALGTYRLLAVRDEFKNLLYVPEADEFGMAAIDLPIGADSARIRGIDFRLAKEDTTAPRLIKVVNIGRRLLRLEFSEEINVRTIGAENFTVIDTVSGRKATIAAAEPVPPRNLEVLLVVDSLTTGSPHTVGARVSDTKGLSINPSASTLVYAVTSEPDTGVVTVASFSFPTMSRDISLSPEIAVMFSRPVRRHLDSLAVSLADSLGNSFDIRTEWQSGMMLMIRPEQTMAGKSWYALTVDASRFTDFFGVRGKDSLFVLKFSTIDTDRFSSLAGTVLDTSVRDAQGPVYVVAREVERRDQEPTSVRIEAPGPFIFRNIVEGRYLIEAFRDRNGNGKFDPGQPFPYVRAERFTVYPDTLKLRARWPVEGLKLQLP